MRSLSILRNADRNGSRIPKVCTSCSVDTISWIRILPRLSLLFFFDRSNWIHSGENEGGCPFVNWSFPETITNRETRSHKESFHTQPHTLKFPSYTTIILRCSKVHNLPTHTQTTELSDHGVWRTDIVNLSSRLWINPTNYKLSQLIMTRSHSRKRDMRKDIDWSLFTDALSGESPSAGHYGQNTNPGARPEMLRCPNTNGTLVIWLRKQ
jgi:hypothetical protein